MVADALAPNRRQAISIHHTDSTNESHHVISISRYTVTPIQQKCSRVVGRLVTLWFYCNWRFDLLTQITPYGCWTGQVSFVQRMKHYLTDAYRCTNQQVCFVCFHFIKMHFENFLQTNVTKNVTVRGISRHYSEAIMGAMASQITNLTIVYSSVYSGADQRKHQSSASLAFVRGIHRWPVNSPHKWPVTRKMFPFDDVTMEIFICSLAHY